MRKPAIKPSLHYVCNPIEYHYQKDVHSISNLQYKIYLLYYGYLPGSHVFESLQYYHNSVLGRNKLIFLELELRIRDSKKIIYTLRNKLYDNKINAHRIIHIVEHLWAMHSWLLLNYNATLESCRENSKFSHVEKYVCFYKHRTANTQNNQLLLSKLIDSIVLLYRYGFDRNIRCKLHTYTNYDNECHKGSNAVCVINCTNDCNINCNDAHERLAEKPKGNMQIMSYNEVIKIFYHLENSKIRLLFLLLFMCDITPDEVVEIKCKDINFYNQSIKIFNFEHSFEHTIIFPGILKASLHEALYSYNPNDFLFGKYFLCNHRLTNIENYYNDLNARMRKKQIFSLQSFLHTGSRLAANGHFESRFFNSLLYNKNSSGTI